MRHVLLLGLMAVSACGSETPRTQITLMIDADPLVKAQLTSVRVNFSSAPLGSPLEDYVAKAPQLFDNPTQWPLVLVLVPQGDEPNRAFQIEASALNGTSVVVEASARSHFVKGKTLALRMRLLDACRNAVFGSCNATETCVVSNGTASCADNAIDPSTLPPFVSVDPEADAGTDASTDAGTDGQVPVVREITGRVFSTNGLLPLNGAQVAVLGGTAVMTDADGVFSLMRGPNDNSLSVEHPDHAVVFKTLPDADSVYIEVFVKQVDARQALSATVGGRVSGTKGASATFPPNAFKQQSGTIERGMADVTLTAPDTKDAAQAQAFPGDFKATASGGKQGALSALSALDLSATSARGKLNIADGEEVEVSFPVKPSSTRTTEELWSFDTVEQSWKKEGTATLTQDASGNVVYRAKITHLSWWAVGALIEDATCMHLCATYNGAAAAYARTTVSGIDQPFQGSFYADASGCVAFDVPLSTQVSVSVQSIDGVAAPQVAISGDTPGSTDDLSSCLALGEVALVDRNSGNSMCPSSLVACGGTACVDINNDNAHCGGCVAPACRNDQSCIDGTCTCSNSETLCDVCTRLASDPRNCGACGTTCGTTERCVQGACVDAGCAPPTVSCGGICVNLAIDGVNGACPMITPPDCTGPVDCAADEMCDPSTGQCGPFVSCTDDSNCPIPYRCNGMSQVCEVANCGMAGYTYCRGSLGCVNLNSNVDACGSCTNPCQSGATCESGTCRTARCGDQIGQPEVGEECDDGNQQNGDGCSATCVVEPGFNCPPAGGICTYADDCDGLDNDSDFAIDEDFVPAACGTDTGECTAGTTVCLSGNPVCTATGPIQESCDGRDNDCDGVNDNGIDLQTNLNNCGACGNVCSVNNGTAACTAGTCTIASCNLPYFDNCDGAYGNGCEADINTDPNNCGTCGNTCLPYTCASGFCQ